MEDASSAEDRREEIRENQAGVGQWERNRRREMAERKDLTFSFFSTLLGCVIFARWMYR